MFQLCHGNEIGYTRAYATDRLISFKFPYDIPNKYEFSLRLSQLRIYSTDLFLAFKLISTISFRPSIELNFVGISGTNANSPAG